MRHGWFIFGSLALFFLMDFQLSAQYPPGGGYPPGGYPPGGYPPGGQGPGGGLPFPRRGKKKTTSKQEPDQASLHSVTGILRQLDDKAIVLEADDSRIMSLQRTAKTKFLKNGEDAKLSVFQPGDHVVVDALQDDQGYLTAVSVNFEKEGTAAERDRASAPVDILMKTTESSGDDDRPVLRRKDAPAGIPGEASPHGAPASAAAASGTAPSPSTQPPGAPQATAPAPAAPQSPAPAPAATPAGSPEYVPSSDSDLDLTRIPVSTSSHKPVDDSDSGPPRIRRGKPAPRKSSPEREANVEVASNAPAEAERDARSAPSAPSQAGAIPAPAADTRPRIELAAARLPASDQPAPAAESAPPDPVIEKARMAAASFTETLPNYFCQEQMARFASITHVVDWQAQDIVSMVVVYDHGHEDYRDLAINGKPVKKNMEQLPGAWSTGEFGSVMVDLFSPSTDADFRHRKESRIAGRDASIYTFTVERENSHWTIVAPSQSVRPSYKGSVWIDKQTARVLRIEMQGTHLPEEFPYDKVESATNYEFIRIGEQMHLLPVHAETLSCETGTNICSRNSIDFRNYHKYTGESSIQFDK